MAISERIGIIRFCETPKNKVKIMYRLGLNNVQAESFLAILTKQSLLTQNNGSMLQPLVDKATFLPTTELEKSNLRQPELRYKRLKNGFSKVRMV